MFGGSRTLGERGQLEDRFVTLLGLAPDVKPFECVGDVDECRAAVRLAAGATTAQGRPAPALRTEPSSATSAAPGPTTHSSHPSGPHSHPRSLCPPGSPGPRSLSASVGVWGLGVEGRPASAASSRWAWSRSWSTTSPPRPRSTTSRFWPRTGRPARVVGLRRRRQEPRASAGTGPKSPHSRARASRAERTRALARGRPPRRVACITGTKGKSTTTAHRRSPPQPPRYDAEVGRQHRAAALGPSAASEPDYWVIETSSFQVPDLTNGPPVVAVTSLSPDHLDWHGSVERYYADKLSLCTKPGVRTAIAEGSSATLRRKGSALGPHVRWVGRRRRGSAVRGRARSACRARTTFAMPRWRGQSSVLGVPRPRTRPDGAAAAGFRGLPSRCHSVGPVGSSSSSTTAYPPTCCRPRRPSRHRRSPGGPVGRRARTRPGLRPPGPGRSGGAPFLRWSSPCPTTGRASERPSAQSGRSGRGHRCRGARRCCGDRMGLGPRADASGASCCSHPRPPASVAYSRLPGAAAAFAEAAGPLRAPRPEPSCSAGCADGSEVLALAEEVPPGVGRDLAAAPTTAGSAPSAASASIDQSACATSWERVHVPEPGALRVHAVVATEPVAPWRRRYRPPALRRRPPWRGRPGVGGCCRGAPSQERRGRGVAGHRMRHRRPGQTTRRARHGVRAAELIRQVRLDELVGPPAGMASPMAATWSGAHAR